MADSELPRVEYAYKSEQEILQTEEALRSEFEQKVTNIAELAVKNGLDSEDAAYVLHDVAKTIASLDYK